MIESAIDWRIMCKFMNGSSRYQALILGTQCIGLLEEQRSFAKLTLTDIIIAGVDDSLWVEQACICLSGVTPKARSPAAAPSMHQRGGRVVHAFMPTSMLHQNIGQVVVPDTRS